MSTKVAYGIVLMVTAIVTVVATPIFRRIALRTGAIVAPDERRVHERPTPLLGGAAMLVGFLAGMTVAWRLDVLSSIFATSPGSISLEPLGVIVAAVLMLAVGTLDDVREVSAPAKVAGIVLCASVLFYAGVNMILFRVPRVGTVLLPTDLSFLISVLWVLGMTNAINLIDGLDGLAAGIVAIASGTFFLYTMQLDAEGVLQAGNIAPLIAVVVLGMCVGFLPWNFHPARIFMGDGGALLLGLLMAASTMAVGGRVDQQCVDTSTVQCSGQTYFFYAPLFIPLFILGVPIFDTLLAIVRRATKRTGVASADKEHIHHRLMRLGHGHRRSVLILWAWTALLSALVLVPIYFGGTGNGLVPVGVAALGLALYTVLHPGVRSTRAERRAHSGAPDETDPAPAAPAAPTDPTLAPATVGGRNGHGRANPDPAGTNGARTHTPGVAAGRVTPEEALAALDQLTPSASPEDPR